MKKQILIFFCLFFFFFLSLKAQDSKQTNFDKNSLCGKVYTSILPSGDWIFYRKGIDTVYLSKAYYFWKPELVETYTGHTIVFSEAPDYKFIVKQCNEELPEPKIPTGQLATVRHIVKHLQFDSDYTIIEASPFPRLEMSYRKKSKIIVSNYEVIYFDGIHLFLAEEKPHTKNGSIHSIETSYYTLYNTPDKKTIWETKDPLFNLRMVENYLKVKNIPYTIIETHKDF